MGRLGIRYNIRLLNPHWTDSRAVGVFVATITCTLWRQVQPSGRMYNFLKCCRSYFLQSLCYQNELLKGCKPQAAFQKTSRAIRFWSKCSGLKSMHWYITITHMGVVQQEPSMMPYSHLTLELWLLFRRRIPAFLVVSKINSWILEQELRDISWARWIPRYADIFPIC